MTRIAPQGRPQDYRTFQIVAPISTHFRPASCEEIGCEQWQNGWTTRLDKTTQAALIKTVHESGRKPLQALDEGGAVTFVFAPGTRCFRETQHALPVGRPEIFLVKDGDWRRTTNARRYDRGDQWVDDFATHQDQLATLINRG